MRKVGFCFVAAALLLSSAARATPTMPPSKEVTDMCYNVAVSARWIEEHRDQGMTEADVIAVVSTVLHGDDEIAGLKWTTSQVYSQKWASPDDAARGVGYACVRTMSVLARDQRRRGVQ